MLFQSTLPQRERPGDVKDGADGFFNFNPRSHKGSDNQRQPVPHVLFFISIHAPTKGATLRALGLPGQLIDFNPRSHKGSDSL